jgi:aspartate/methionine/tyrosine aminotransferase
LQALYVVTQTLLKPGDEVVVFEPGFDLYRKQAERAGAVVRPVSMTLREGSWEVHPSDLESAITARTKLLLINTPQNPTGMVFDEALLRRIADIVRAHPQMLVLVDEVYKHAIYDSTVAHDVAQNMPTDAPGHVHFASLPEMWERTITISSAGKTFSVTGWQVGWAVGPEHLIQPIHVSAHVLYFTCPRSLLVASLTC